jgi:hypothetical protein
VGTAHQHASLSGSPRHATVQALTDAVLSALRGGDMVAARAAARALSAFVDELGDSVLPQQGETVQDLARARRRRERAK